MGKHCGLKINDNNDEDTKILFKKSNATFSHSRTISGVSQLYSRSGIMQIKRNSGTNHHRYYTDRGKIKRDFSVETDICILRRYYRKKKNSLLGENSAKSRYSTLIDTECETIEEYPDTSACGDNDNDNDTEKSNTHLDIASLMIDNLKDLLNQWIQKHLIQNKDTKQKIDTVLDSLIRKLETRNTTVSSSGSTYILHKEAGKQEVKNKKIATASLTCQCCKHQPYYVNVESSAAVSSESQKRSSGITVPFNYKDIRIISTLSIPRTFHRRLEEKNDQNTWHRMKKYKNKNLVLSIGQSNKLVNSSSFDLVAISTKSLTKRSTNNETITKKKKKHIVFFPQPFYKSATETSSATINGNLQTKNTHVDKDRCSAMPSLLESLYANDPIMPEKNIKYARSTHNNTCTMTEKSISEVTMSNQKVPSEFTKDIHAKQAKEKYLPGKNKTTSFIKMDSKDCRIEMPKKSSVIFPEITRTKNIHKKATRRGKIKKLRQRSPFQSIHNKQFTFLYKKAQSQTSPGEEFLKHCQNIMQFFEEYKNNNIKLDVQINVYPSCQSNKKNVCTGVSYQTLGAYDIKFNPTLLNNIEPKIDTTMHMDEEPVKFNIINENRPKEQHHLPSLSKVRTPEIITLLDSSVLQTKYIFDGNSKEKVDALSKPNVAENSYAEQSTITTELEIVQEISELRAVIRDLAAAAERFVNEQLRRESNKSNAETIISRNPSNYTSSSKVEAIINLRNPSKAIQYSKEVIEKQKQKITEEPKKKETFEFYNKLVKKSTSYRIFESESILRVTDMTSGANELNKPPDTLETRDTRANKDALRRSTQKSKSAFELTPEPARKRKSVSSFCEGYRKNLQCRVCSVHRNRSPSCSEKSGNQFIKLFGWSSKRQETCQQSATTPVLPPCICGSGTNLTNSLPVIGPQPDGVLNQSSYSSVEVRCRSCPDEEEKGATICSCEDEQTATMESVEDDQMRLQKCCNKRRGMGFGEGCVYCVLLWIPICLLICLFYAYVLKDRLNILSSHSNINVQPRNIVIRNQSVRLSDLGF